MRGNFERSRGITLKGLVVVIVILVAAVLLLRPIFLKMGSGAVSAACRNNLMKIGKAVQQYANDYNEFVPPAAWYGPAGSVSWRQSLTEYLPKDENVFKCPAKHEADVGYAVNYVTFGRNIKGVEPPNSNCVTMKQIKDAGRTLYALDTGKVTDETKNEPPSKWVETPDDAPDYCRVTRDEKDYWTTDPVRPMPRHAGKVNCLMLNGAVLSYTVDDIIKPDEKDEACIWDKY